HAVAVGELAFEHVAHDLHVPVAVGAEAGAGGDGVVVDDAQVAHAHVGRVVVVGEREGVEALEPAVVGNTAVFGFAQGDHDVGPPVDAFTVGSRPVRRGEG